MGVQAEDASSVSILVRVRDQGSWFVGPAVPDFPCCRASFTAAALGLSSLLHWWSALNFHFLLLILPILRDVPGVPIHGISTDLD